MSKLASTEGEHPPPEKLSIDDFLKGKGVDSFGTAVFRGEVTSTAEDIIRLRESEADGKARRRLELLNFIVKDALGYVVALFLVIVLTAGSGSVWLNSQSSEEDKEGAQAMLLAIGSAVAGYTFGKGSNAHKP